MRINPYFQRQGDARDQIETYQRIFGGELTLTTFADFGGMGLPEAEHGHVMHADLIVSDSMSLMSADLPSSMEPTESNPHVSLSGRDAATLRGWFEALAEGGSIDVPMEKAPWGDFFGQVKDRFGVNWLVNAADQ